MQVEVESVRRLSFDDGTPVRAASAVAPYGDGRLVVQDDATHAAWVRTGSVERLRVFPPVEGHEVFDAASGTKHLKPDLEAACALPDGRVLLLGSGSAPRRTRVALVGPDGVVARDLETLYRAVEAVLGTPPGVLNLEGACVVGGRLRWFQRGAATVPSASVDVDLDALVAVLEGKADAQEVTVGSPRSYVLGEADGVALAVTDAVTLPDGTVLVSAAAEDTPNPVDDGPVVAAALALLDGDRVLARTDLPEPGGRVHKVEGLTLLAEPGDDEHADHEHADQQHADPQHDDPQHADPEHDDRGLALVAVVDDDDATTASTELVLRVTL